MRNRYYERWLALPPGITFGAGLQREDQVDMDAVNDYVNGLQRRPDWYTHDHSSHYDTRRYMTEVIHRPTEAVITRRDRGSGRMTETLELTWDCECCGQIVLYNGLQLGHRRRWQDELRRAAVTTLPEARAAYNNLNNLRIECATCNAGHDWENSESESDWELSASDSEAESSSSMDWEAESSSGEAG